MASKSTSEGYGRTAQLYHWVSAVLIIAMIPLGLIMGDIESESTKIMLYRWHVMIGVLIFLITVARIVWRRKDSEPDPPEGLHGMHLKAFNAIHVLLYVLIVVLAFSGVGIVILGGLADILSGASTHSIPADLNGFASGVVHEIAAKIYIALLIGHIGGVVFHQITKSDVLSRMGITYFKAKQGA